MCHRVWAERFLPMAFNIGVNDGKAVGQTVEHGHIHIIPRYDRDVDDPRGGIRWILPQKAKYWDSAVNHPPPEQQIEFLINLQRLFNEGSFVATYKFALLSALANLSVENGSDTDAELDIPTRDIAEKFVKYYWRQSRPFLPKGKIGAAIILRQNAGEEAEVIRMLQELSENGMNSLNSLQGNHRLWSKTH